MALKTQTFTAGSYAYQSWSNGYVITLKLTQESSNASANTSVISYLFTISNTDNNRFYDYYYSWDISIGGQTIPIRNFYFDLRNNHTTQTIASGEITVSHNGDGSLRLPYNVTIPNVQASNQYGPPAMALSDYWDLISTPRRASVYCPDGTIGNSIDIAIERTEVGQTCTLTYGFGNLRGTIVEKTDQAEVTWRIPTEFYSQIPGAMVGEGAVFCTTYMGDTLLGTESCVLYAYVDESTSKPTIVPSIVDVNSETLALTGDENTLVRYCSNVRAGAEYIGNNSAEITYHKMTHNGRNHYVNPVSIRSVENGVFDFVATDSRGCTTNLRVNKPMIPYVKLTCDLQEVKADPEGNLELRLSGNWFAGSFGAVDNTLKVQFRYKVGSGNYKDWVDLEPVVTGNTYTAQGSVTGLDHRQPHTVQARAIDQLDTEKSVEYTVRVLPVFDWGEHDFNVNGTLNINNLPVADYVVEQGTSGIWNYRKWNSGAAELWGIKRFVSTADATSPVSGFYLNILSVDYPFEFKDIPIAVGSYMAVGTYAFADSVFRETQKFSQRLHIYDGNKDVYANIYVSGSWK